MGVAPGAPTFCCVIDTFAVFACETAVYSVAPRMGILTDDCRRGHPATGMNNGRVNGRVNAAVGPSSASPAATRVPQRRYQFPTLVASIPATSISIHDNGYI